MQINNAEYLFDMKTGPAALWYNIENGQMCHNSTNIGRKASGVTSLRS